MLGKYFTTSNYNKVTSGINDVKINKKQLVIKSDTLNFLKRSDLDTKHATVAKKAVSKVKQYKDYKRLI